MGKRITSVILLAVLLLISIPFSAAAETYSYAISGYNVARGENYLVIYNYSGSNTNTNTYGYEVTVTNDVVTAVGGNNNYIPYGGYVVSGHGEAGDWLMSNVILGMKVSISGGYVTFTSDNNTYKYVITVARDKALEAKSYAASACLVYDESADSRFAAAEARYNALGSDVSEAVSNELVAEYNAVAALYRERAVSEYRGVWLRPTQKSAAEVESFVRDCYEAGINMISVETMYCGTMICPMPSDSLFEHNPVFNDFDVLGSFVEVCHRYGMELHCWMPVFYSCNSAETNWPLSVAAKKPEWCLVSNNGSTLYNGEETGMVFLNPALSEVQDFLAETYTYLLETYDIDGFQLDYIRYKDRNSDEDFGYDSTTVQLFKEAYPQYRNYTIYYNPGSSYWNSWVTFRQDQVTKFVERMRGIIDEVSPGTLLSADVGASIDSSATWLYQDSTYWLQQGWLDMIHPMAYGEDYAPYVEPLYDYTDEGCIVVPGLGIFMDEFDAEDMLKQTCEMLDIDCDGVVYFEATAFASKNCGDVLTDSIFTELAIAPALNNANTVVAELERFVERLGIAYETGLINWQTQNDLTWIANQGIAEAKNTNANAAAVWTAALKENVVNYIAAGDLCDRLLLDVGNANAAALRDQGIDVYTEMDIIDNTVPDDAVGAVQLTIDKVNGALTGEDSTLITDVSAYGSYNTKYAYVMLLKPVFGYNGVYEIVEGIQNAGSDTAFKTEITDGMLIAAFHTDNVGSGLERRDLARSLEVGTTLVLYGVNVKTGMFTSLNPMLYVTDDVIVIDPDVIQPNPNADYDVNADGTVDMYDYLMIKAIYFEKYIPTEAERNRANIYEDDNIDMYDYLLLKNYIFNN